MLGVLSAWLKFLNTRTKNNLIRRFPFSLDSMSGISSVYCYLHRRHFKYTRAIPRHFQVFCYHVILFRVLIGYFGTDLDWPFPQSSYLSSKQPRLKNSWTQISWNLYALRSLKFPTLWKMYVYILAAKRMILCVDFRTRQDTCKTTTIEDNFHRFGTDKLSSVWAW